MLLLYGTQAAVRAPIIPPTKKYQKSCRIYPTGSALTTVVLRVRPSNNTQSPHSPTGPSADDRGGRPPKHTLRPAEKPACHFHGRRCRQQQPLPGHRRPAPGRPGVRRRRRRHRHGGRHHPWRHRRRSRRLKRLGRRQRPHRRRWLGRHKRLRARQRRLRRRRGRRGHRRRDYHPATSRPAAAAAHGGGLGGRPRHPRHERRRRAHRGRPAGAPPTGAHPWRRPRSTVLRLLLRWRRERGQQVGASAGRACCHGRATLRRGQARVTGGPGAGGRYGLGGGIGGARGRGGGYGGGLHDHGLTIHVVVGKAAGGGAESGGGGEASARPHDKRRQRVSRVREWLYDTDTRRMRTASKRRRDAPVPRVCRPPRQE